MEDRPDVSYLFCKANLSHRLIDRRSASLGIVLGTIQDVAKQYGVEFMQVPGGWVFAAPKTRLQMFAEKLHFSAVPFKPIKDSNDERIRRNRKRNEIPHNFQSDYRK